MSAKENWLSISEWLILSCFLSAFFTLRMRFGYWVGKALKVNFDYWNEYVFSFAVCASVFVPIVVSCCRNRGGHILKGLRVAAAASLLLWTLAEYETRVFREYRTCMFVPGQTEGSNRVCGADPRSKRLFGVSDSIFGIEFWELRDWEASIGGVTVQKN